MTDFTLKRTVAVAADPDRGAPRGELIHLEAGTPLEEIPAAELAQLSPAHFVATDSDELPDDWRTDEATLAHDRRQAKNRAAEQKARDKERAARRAEKAAES